MAARPTVLVVGDDAVNCRLVRNSLEREAIRVLEAATLAQVRALLGESVDGVVLDRRLVDGDGICLVPVLVARWPWVPIVVFRSFPDESCTDDRGLSAAQGYVAGLVDKLGLAVHGAPPLSPAAHVTRDQAEGLKQRWEELCEWDPSLPADAEPALAETMVHALSVALDRPQPLGWGLDPALESTAEAFAVSAGSIDGALAQLVCLHEAFLQGVIDLIPLADRDEARARLDMIIHRTMVVAGQASLRHLTEQVLIDPLTGIHNRRAFERDLEREVARARRHGRPLTLGIVDVDGLKEINDSQGHRAGDDTLRAVAGALGRTTRQEDGAYRIGGDEFALILVDTDVSDEDVVVDRLRTAGAPPCSVGLARLPAPAAAYAEAEAEAEAESDLIKRADERLYALRRRCRRSRVTHDA